MVNSLVVAGAVVVVVGVVVVGAKVPLTAGGGSGGGRCGGSRGDTAATDEGYDLVFTGGDAGEATEAHMACLHR